MRRTMVEPARAIDVDHVRAWQARRTLNHLVGYGLLPLLWRKLLVSRSGGGCSRWRRGSCASARRRWRGSRCARTGPSEREVAAGGRARFGDRRHDPVSDRN